MIPRVGPRIEPDFLFLRCAIKIQIVFCQPDRAHGDVVGSGSMHRRLRNFAASLLAGLLVSSCAAVDVGPINTEAALTPRPSPAFIPDSGDDGSTVIGLAFSGGGMRAAAFSYGVLRELDDMTIDTVPYRRSMVDNIRLISGVSGGAVAAAYFGYRGRDDYRDFRERFLLRNAEEAMRTSISPVNLARAINGGVNDRNALAGWLDRNLFNGATFKSFKWKNAPIVWINASDIYNRTPFLFTYDTFAALCSDLDAVRVADAVAASAAVPVVFSPIVLAANKTGCAYEKPDWLKRALEAPDVSIRLRAYARALDAYHTPDRLNYIKLVDGALTDNLGLTGFVLERAAAQTPYGPLSAEEAVKLRRMLFIVADAGRGQTADWGMTREGPRIGALVQAAMDTAVASSVRDQVDALNFAVEAWEETLKRYRCGLPLDQVRRIRGTTAGWNCRDIDIVVERLAFPDLAPDLQKKLNAIPTRLKLPADQVDLIIEAGRTAVRERKSINDIAAEIRRSADVHLVQAAAGR